MSVKQTIKELLKPSPRKAGLTILKNTPMLVVDVGAANGLVPHWQVLDGLAQVVSFEPHEASYKELLAKYAKSDYSHMYKPFPFGLSKNGGKTTLYMLNERTGSSILPVDNESPYLIKDDPYVFPITEIEIETKSLKEVFESENLGNPSMIKLDIQGAEIEVLEGLGTERIDNLLSIEMEVGFRSIHKNAPTPFSTIEWMEKFGFDFFDMTTNRLYTGKGTDSKYYLKALGVSSVYNKVANRLVETDLLFFKKQDVVLNSGSSNQARLLIVAYCVYNFFTDACQFNDKALEAGLFTKDDHQQIINAVKNWSNIYNKWYPSSLEGFHYKLKNLKSHLRHKPWQTPTKEL